jgi:hypothetical protein
MSPPPTHVSPPEIAALEALDWSFSQDPRRDLTHNLHPWPAKFIPQIPAAVIEALTTPGDRVHDPFVGCGTTALEAIRLGRTATVSDVNPLAALITEAKCFPPRGSELLEIEQWANALKIARPSKRSKASAPPIPNIEDWFSPSAIAQLAYLRDAIASRGTDQAFLRVVFSAIVLLSSHQESETRYRRVDREVSASDVLARFQKRLVRSLKMAAAVELAIPSPPGEVEIECRDSRLIPDSSERSSDLAVFSPPYPNAFDYHLYHRFRLFWLGYDPRPLKHSEIGAHLRYLDSDVWQEDMRLSLRAASSRLRNGAYCVVLVGDGIVRGELVRSGDLLWELAPDTGLTPIWRATRPISQTKRAFNLSDSRLKKEDILVFQK